MLARIDLNALLLDITTGEFQQQRLFRVSFCASRAADEYFIEIDATPEFTNDNGDIENAASIGISQYPFMELVGFYSCRLNLPVEAVFPSSNNTERFETGKTAQLQWYSPGLSLRDPD